MSKIRELYFLLACLVLIKMNEALTTFGHVRNENTAHNPTNNQLELVQSGPEIISIQISNLQALLTGLSEQPSDEYYDKHFNCIKNCRTPTCLSKRYAQQPAELPKNCAEASATNEFNEGIYLHNISHNELKPFYAYCSLENSTEKAWTIIQRREDGAVSFNRNWFDYKHGFGDLNGDYWLGLERLHAMTMAKPYELWIFLKDYNGNEKHAKYANFKIADESEAYKLIIDSYSGDAGDSLVGHRNMKFSTYDNDNDLHFINCAHAFKGGWWYFDGYSCNLNGVYRSILNKKTGEGIEWFDSFGFDESLKYAHMAIRPI